MLHSFRPYFPFSYEDQQAAHGFALQSIIGALNEQTLSPPADGPVYEMLTPKLVAPSSAIL